MKSCKEVRELRNENYKELLTYIENKILNSLNKGFIFVDEDEVIEHDVKFNDNRWIDLLEDTGYKVEYCNNFVTPTVEISGW